MFQIMCLDCGHIMDITDMPNHDNHCKAPKRKYCNNCCEIIPNSSDKTYCSKCALLLDNEEKIQQTSPLPTKPMPTTVESDLFDGNQNRRA